MITDQNQARGLKRYKQLKLRAEASGLAMKHLGVKQSEGEDTHHYFDNFELTSTPLKTVFYNIFTLAFDVILYIGLISYLWTPSTAMWVVILALSGASVIFLFLLITKLLEVRMMIKVMKQNKRKKKNNGYLSKIIRYETGQYALDDEEEDPYE